MKPVKQMIDIDESHNQVVRDTVQNIGLESAFEHAGERASAYRS
jgi:delta 1-pyrroline-5-carboxylate dehydrogenase